MKKWRNIIFGSIIVVGVFNCFFSFFFGFPIPRGTRVCAGYNTYYKNWKGIYYISVEHVLSLINHGHWGYLEDVDEKTFTVLDDNLAKDSKSVWYMDKIIKSADAASFHLDKSGLPKDKNYVYVYGADIDNFRPTKCGIDVQTAEYFVCKHDGQDGSWMRDKDFVYLDERKLDVDRNTFAPLGNSYWWTDREYLYRDAWDSTVEKNILIRVDSLQSPVDTLSAGCYYLRNGRNIVRLGTVIAKDIDVERFEEVGLDKCIVNDMLFYQGERILKDSLDVSAAKFYFYGHIAADREHVFYGRKQLNDVDAATFHQIGDEAFEDKNFIYTIKENSWNGEYPFDKKKKGMMNR